uniref:LOW QUALITY PROTEIN: EH domain-binding protein 1-like protein 1 n=1 Tax=Agelaius phoeniceus TaxID=39638 RepID=UPI0023EE287C|nr:LOW QUALITY PROTEIN: EH domain-binding protein 1-like protein 1 [Agelaius phoeniceus]
MGSVWKRLQRAGKRAAKVRFEATLEELLVEGGGQLVSDPPQPPHTPPDTPKSPRNPPDLPGPPQSPTPDRLTVVWSRRHRRVCSKPRRWQPGIQDPRRGMVVWVVPETLEVVVTLYRDPQAAAFDDKTWNFLVVNESRGRRSVVAAAPLELGRLAGVGDTPLSLSLRPRTRKVTTATLRLRLRGLVLMEGHPTDEDMQSVTSLSPPGDVADLGDFESDPEDGGAHRAGGAPPVSRAPPPRGDPPNWGTQRDPPEPGGDPETPPEMTADPPGGRGALLAWCRGVTAGYRGSPITDFGGSWSSGLGFCALLHRLRPREIDFHALDPRDHRANNKRAFDAFAALGVPRLLDPSDMETPDSLGVMTFLSQVRALLGTPPGTPPDPRSGSIEGGRPPESPSDVTEGGPQRTLLETPLDSQRGTPNDPPGGPPRTLGVTSQRGGPKGRPRGRPRPPRAAPLRRSPQRPPGTPRPPQRPQPGPPQNPKSASLRGGPKRPPQSPPRRTLSRGRPPQNPPSAAPPRGERPQTPQWRGSPPRTPPLPEPRGGPRPAPAGTPQTETLQEGGSPPRDPQLGPVEGEPPQDPPPAFGEGAPVPESLPRPPRPAGVGRGLPTPPPRSRSFPRLRDPPPKGDVGTPPAPPPSGEPRGESGSPPCPPPETPREPPETPEEESGGQWVAAELLALEQEQARLDSQAPALERELRELMDSGADPAREERLLRAWFSLVQQRNLLVRRQDQLQLLAQERDLERRFELLSRELRGLLGTEEWQKPPAQREREQLLLEELVALVNRRDRLVQDRHRRESRALEEDEELRRSLEPRRRRFGRRETCGIC